MLYSKKMHLELLSFTTSLMTYYNDRVGGYLKLKGILLTLGGSLLVSGIVTHHHGMITYSWIPLSIFWFLHLWMCRKKYLTDAKYIDHLSDMLLSNNIDTYKMERLQHDLIEFLNKRPIKFKDHFYSIMYPKRDNFKMDIPKPVGSKLRIHLRKGTLKGKDLVLYTQDD